MAGSLIQIVGSKTFGQVEEETDFIVNFQNV